MFDAFLVCRSPVRLDLRSVRVLFVRSVDLAKSNKEAQMLIIYVHIYKATTIYYNEQLIFDSKTIVSAEDTVFVFSIWSEME